MAIACSGVAQEARTAEVNYFLGYRVEFSDNIRRVATGQEKETLNVLFGGVVYQDTTPALDLRFAPAAEYLDYKRDTFDDEARLTLDSSAIWTLSPRRLTWTLQDTARQVRIDPTRPDTPANTALANFLSTGPDLYVRFTNINTLQLGARYVNVYVAETDLDNERGEGYARWLYQYSPITVLSLNYDVQEARFENPTISPNFERRDAYFRVTTQQARSTFVADLGRTQIKREAADDLAGGLARLTWTRRSTMETNFGLLAESGFSDTGTDLEATAAAANAPAEGGAAQTVSQNLVARDIFRAKRADIFFDRRGTRFASTFRLSERRLEFQAAPLDDRDEGIVDVALTYFYSAASSLGIYGRRGRIEYRNRVLTDTDTTVGVRWQRSITRSVSVSLDFQRWERSSTDPGREFTEDRVLLGVLYSSGPVQRGQ